MSEMIDRVAKAIKDSGAYCPDWQGGDEDLPDMARAAIEAMREPTEAMLEEVEDPYNDGISKYKVREVWIACVDAILK